MNDLTRGSIPRHILALATPIAIGMMFQTLYYLVDLFFVSRLGDEAIAGVAAAGNAQFIVLALTQVLGVGSMTLIAHAVGQKERQGANQIFHQSLLLAALSATLVLGLGYGLMHRYMASLGADGATVRAGVEYLTFFLPGLALQFAQVAMDSALRGTGITKPTMVVQMLTVLLNAILSPLLITGWLTGHPLGVAGAGLATSISIAVGVVVMALYFIRLGRYVRFDAGQLHPEPRVWGRILKIGVPPGGEFALMFVYFSVIYWVARGFGSEAQAGFGIGSRVMQAIFLPAMAVSFATAPVAGQNFGAGHHDRVRQTFRSAAGIGSSIMVVLTLLCQWRPDLLGRPFTDQPEVLAVSGEFLRIISWNFVASGLIFTCSGMFQALGNTLPGVTSSSTRLLTFVLPAVWLTTWAGFELRHLWYLSVTSVALQALTSLVLVRIQLRRRLSSGGSTAPPTDRPG